MVEGARLERVCTSNRTQGSNPCLSAKYTVEIKSAAQQGRRLQLSDTTLTMIIIMTRVRIITSWYTRRDSNARPLVPQTNALSS